VVWHSGGVLARLVLGWVTMFWFNSRRIHLSHYVTSHSGQLSLAIPSWVGTMSPSKGQWHLAAGE